MSRLPPSSAIPFSTVVLKVCFMIKKISAIVNVEKKKRMSR